MHKIVSFFTLLFFGFILWITYLANTGGHSAIFDIVRTTRNGDKIGHFFLYGTLAFALNLSLRLRYFRWHKIRMYWGTLAVGIFVVLEELSQAFFPRRSLDAHDLYADAAGILSFTLLTLFIHAILHYWNTRQTQP